MAAKARWQDMRAGRISLFDYMMGPEDATPIGFGGAARGVGMVLKGSRNILPYLAQLARGASSQIALFGKNSVGHLIKHRDVLGFENVSAQQAQKMLPQLRSTVNQLLNGANPTLTRVGQWHQHENAIMYITNGKMLVTEANGTFITVINKTSNNWYQLASPLK